MSLVYGEFHARAAHYMRGERPDHSLRPTELVNEAYLRMLQGEAIDFQSRAHFFATASVVMRRVLVDHARAHNAEMRSGGLQRVEMEDGFMVSTERSAEVLALHDALTALEKVDARQAKVVELRYFGGFSVEEIGDLLGMSPRSVKRHWALARIWLHKRMKRPEENTGIPQEDSI